MKKLILIACGVALTAFSRLPAQTDPELLLTIHLTNLVEAIAQPTTGVWDPSNDSVRLPDTATNGAFALFCGPTIAVTFGTKTNHFYECQASDDTKNWLGGVTVVGTGRAVTIYDKSTYPHRLYRVSETMP